MANADTVERHKDAERNLILNRTLSDLDDIINGHDPEIDTSINNGVWDRLDKMALEIEARAAIAALPPAVTQDDAFKAGQFAAADAIAKQCWHDGVPLKPYGSEWFIAKLDDGSKVVLRELHEDHSYDFTTRDETYLAAFRVVKWMQFPDSNFIPYLPTTPDPVAEAAKVLQQTRVKDEHIEAAMIAHYGKRSAELTIHGVDLTSNSKNWTFKDGFKRMLKGYLRALTKDGEAG